MALHEFVTTNRDLIIARTKEKLTNRPWPRASTSELENGVPLFLAQLSEVLQSETQTGSSQRAIGSTATLHGGELLRLGFTVSQVVHDYGDICQVITELAVEQDAPITPHEFHLLNRCLDTAIAEAVTEHARLTAMMQSDEELERSGVLAHEMRNMLSTAVFAFEALKGGTVAVNGSTGSLLGRTLMSLRDLVDTTVSDIRLSANRETREWISAAAFFTDLVVAAHLHAGFRQIHFSFETAVEGVNMNVDRQLLASAVTNLLSNAFKFTPANGHVVLRARLLNGALTIEVEDECGGIPGSHGDLFRPYGDQRGSDRSGLGLGLSIARKAVTAHHGDIQIQNLPGKGCIFAIHLPLTEDAAGAASAT